MPSTRHTASRPGNRRCRRLAFELCEPRLALAAAVGAAADVGNTAVALDDVVVAAPRFVAVAASSLALNGSPHLAPAAHGTATAALHSLWSEGGAVTLHRLTNASQIPSGDSVNQTLLDAAFDGTGNMSTLDGAGPWSPIAGSGPDSWESSAGFTGGAAQWQSLAPPSRSAPRSDLDGVLAGLGGDARLLRGEPEIIRIVGAPRGADGEGGAISLAAIVQPGDVLSAEPRASFALAGGSGPMPPVAAPRAGRPTEPIAALRARALALRVSLVDDAAYGDDGAATSPDARHHSEEPPAPQEATAAQPQDRDAATRDDEAPRTTAPAVEDRAAARPASESPADDDPRQTLDHAAARDAALSGWDDRPPLTAAEAGAEAALAAQRNRQWAATAAAVALGAAPILGRRARPSASEGQQPIRRLPR
ncbi:MAG TPA: hypothetical protein PJ982_07120 [Lacipirellulaceae bacterium]|nr:hypothetical protein [Lacipirellulaceae bacterium]